MLHNGMDGWKVGSGGNRAGKGQGLASSGHCGVKNPALGIWELASQEYGMLPDWSRQGLGSQALPRHLPRKFQRFLSFDPFFS